MRRLVALLFSITLVACGGPAAETAQVSPTPSASEPSVAPRPSADAWLDAIPSYTYQEQACDPTDPRLAAAGIKLPVGEGKTARIAATCVALEWLANADVKYPKIDIISSKAISKRAVATLQESARAQFRLYWKYRNPAVTQPSVFVFDSIKFLCTEGPKYFGKDRYFLNLPLDPTGQAVGNTGGGKFSCADTSRTWSCANKPGSADGQPAGSWLDPGRGGNISLVCPDDLAGDISVVQHKFYQGIVLRCGDHEAYPFCAHWERGADYLFTYYAERLSSASFGSSGNMSICESWRDARFCSTSGFYFHSYIPSSNWMFIVQQFCWPGTEPYGKDGECSEADRMSGVTDLYAFEWITSHFGLEAAYGLIPVSQSAGADPDHYRSILQAYTGMSTDDFFAAIDKYVVARLGDRIR